MRWFMADYAGGGIALRIMRKIFFGADKAMPTSLASLHNRMKVGRVCSYRVIIFGLATHLV